MVFLVSSGALYLPSPSGYGGVRVASGGCASFGVAPRTAFLLQVVQPGFAKVILPAFGKLVFQCPFWPEAGVGED